MFHVLLAGLMVVFFSLGIANAADTHTLVCVDEANRTLVFADGDMYRLLDDQWNKLCPHGLPVSCTIVERFPSGQGPTHPCCEITNAVTKTRVLAVRAYKAQHQK